MYKSYSELGAEPEQKNVDLFSVIELESMQQKQQYIAQNRVVVIDIYSDWCGPCRRISPTFAVMAQKYGQPGKCILLKENYEKKLSPNINGVPTFHFFVEGKMVDEVIGADVESVEAKLIKILQAVNQSSSTASQGPQFSRNALRAHTPGQYNHNNFGNYTDSGQPSNSNPGPLYHQYNQ